MIGMNKKVSLEEKTRVAIFEFEEVRRVFEKYGISELLVSADGSLSPHIGVLRLCKLCLDNNFLTKIHEAIYIAKQIRNDV